MDKDSMLVSLRRTLAASNPSLNSSLTWAGGTEYGANYSHPPESSYSYHPLPEATQTTNLVHLPTNSPTSHLKKSGPMELWHPAVPASQQGKHLVSRNMIFPRLAGAPDAVMAKLLPVLNDLIQNFSARDIAGTGHLHQEQIKLGLRDTHVFLTTAEVDALVSIATRNPAGEINWLSITDQIDGKVPDPFSTTSSGLIAGRPPLPQAFNWPTDQSLAVCLRLRPNSQPYEISAQQMQAFAKKLTVIRKEEGDAEKVHGLMRYALLQDLVIAPGRPGHPDLAFRDWLSSTGVLSITMRDYPGPIPPEVYDIFDQIIYSMGIPVVMSSTMTLTALGGSMRHNHH